MQHCSDEIGLPNMLSRDPGEKDKELSNQKMTSVAYLSTGNHTSSIQEIPTIDLCAENQINSIQKISTLDQKIPTIDVSSENRDSSIQNIPTIDFSSDKEEDLWNDPVMHSLSEALRIQHYALREVYAELEAERSASATSIDDALLMISRLQDEKARLAMEAAQFKREAQEKISHAETTLSFYEDVLLRKDEEIKALQCEIEAFRHRFLSYGIHGDIGFRLSDTDGYVGMPGNAFAEKNSFNNQDELGGFMARSFTADCENCSDLKPEGSVSKEIGMGFSEAVKINHGDQGGEDERKQVNTIERARHFPEDTFSGNYHLLWEQIEGLQKKLHNLLEKKILSPDLKDECKSTCDELKDALASYTTSLSQGLKSHWMGSFPEIQEAEVKANIDQTDGPVDVHMDTTQMGDRQEKFSSFIQTSKEEFSELSLIENNTLELMQSKIEDLSLRIGALEDDKSVKQAMDSLKRQQYIVKHFKQIVQGFHKSEEPPKGQIKMKVVFLQRFLTIASLIKYFLSQLPVGVRCILSFLLFRSYKYLQRK